VTGLVDTELLVTPCTSPGADTRSPRDHGPQGGWTPALRGWGFHLGLDQGDAHAPDVAKRGTAVAEGLAGNESVAIWEERLTALFPLPGETMMGAHGGKAKTSSMTIRGQR